MLTNGITFTLLNGKISTEWRNDVIEGLDSYVKQINIKKYNDYIITYNFVCAGCTLKKSSEMRVTCERIFKEKHLKIKNVDSFM